MSGTTKLVGIIGVIVVIVAAIGLYAHYNSGKSGSTVTSVQTTAATTINGYTSSIGQSSSSGVSTPIMMVDPPYVPSDAQALIVSYSNVMVHTKGPNGSGWIDAQGSGTVNLMSATTANSTSKIVAYANLSAGTEVDMVSYTIDSASIVVNGTAHSVIVANPSVTANVTGSGNVSQSASVLVDVTPTVFAAYNQNTTQYEMVSSSDAVVVANAGASLNAGVGSNVQLNAGADAQVTAAQPDISITGAVIFTSGNSTNVSVSVKNNGNTSVTLYNLILYGQQNLSTSPSLGLNLSIGAGLLGGKTNVSANAALFSGLLLNISTANIVAFSSAQGGALSLAANGTSGVSAGTVLAPGSSATLTYDGKIYYDSGLIQGNLRSGNQYTLAVTGSEGASAKSTVTAK